MEETIKPKKSVLMLADFGCNSGFAQVAHNIVNQVLQDKEIDWYFDVIGINYFGEPNAWSQVFPRVRMFPAVHLSKGDVFGRQAFLDRLGMGVYDLAFILQDTFIVEPLGEKIIEMRNLLAKNGSKVCRWIYYFPIDAEPKENWVKKTVSLADVPVSYTQYGYDECVKKDESLKDKLKIVPHGTEEKVFFRLEQDKIDSFRHEYFAGKADGKWLITNVNRNQPRKDVARTLQVYSLVKQRVADAQLYLHMKENDVAYGIYEAARNFGLTPDDFIIPKEFDEHDGLPVHFVNAIYNSSQALMTTTLGEGWGLSLTEAMAAKTPVVAPRNSACAEILADGRGLLADSGKTQSEWMILPHDNERLRPVTNVADMVDKLVWLRQNYKSDEVTKMVEKAHKYVLGMTWDKVGETWRQIFKSSLIAEKTNKVGRNDPCPCGSGKKYKNCCLRLT